MLPIIIIFERHWDVIPKEVVKSLLPLLAREGYDTLCFEAPLQYSQADFHKTTEDHLESEKEILKSAMACLRNAGIVISESELLDMHYDKLSHLMCLYASSQKYKELAYKFKTFRATQEINNIIKLARELSISLCGVDHEKQMTRIDVDFWQGAKEITETMSSRNQIIFTNLLNAIENQKSIIFLCGALHADALISFFEKNELSNNVLFYFLHNGNFFANSVQDADKDILRSQRVLRARSVLLRDKKEVDQFVHKLAGETKEKIAFNLSALEEIKEEFVHTSILSGFLGSKVQAMRSSEYYVDAWIEEKNVVNAKEKIKKLMQHQIHSRMLLFKDKKYLVIPFVNTNAVAKKLRGII